MNRQLNFFDLLKRVRKLETGKPFPGAFRVLWADEVPEVWGVDEDGQRIILHWDDEDDE